MAGLVVAIFGTFAAQRFDRPDLDGWASIGIAAILAATAIFLARESKGLLIGERARPGLVRALCRLASEQRGVSDATSVLTVHLAPDQVVAALDVHFDPNLAARDVTAAANDLERRVKAEHPEVITVFLRMR